MSFDRKIFTEGVTYHQADWTELQDNIGNYYDALIAALQGQVDGILADYLTSAHRLEANPHALIDMDYVKQGTAFIKLSAAEYAEFLTGFYDILDLTTTVQFGYDRDIAGFYFAKSGDADGANIYANDLFSRGNPVYTIVYATSWVQLTAGNSTGATTHGLGYRPSFAILQEALSDPTGSPEEYVYTDNFARSENLGTSDSYARWNNTDYEINNNSPWTVSFRLLLFAYLGS